MHPDSKIYPAGVVDVVVQGVDIAADSEMAARDCYTVVAFVAAYSLNVELVVAAGEDSVVAVPPVLVAALDWAGSEHSCCHSSKLQQGHPTQDVLRGAELVDMVVGTRPLLGPGLTIDGDTWDHFL